MVLSVDGDWCITPIPEVRTVVANFLIAGGRAAVLCDDDRNQRVLDGLAEGYGDLYLPIGVVVVS